MTLSHDSGISPLTDGDHDWMDPKGGVQSVERLRQAGNGQGKMYLVGNAGHHGSSSLDQLLARVKTQFPPVYLDNHTAVNELLVKELEKEYENAVLDAQS